MTPHDDIQPHEQDYTASFRGLLGVLALLGVLYFLIAWFGALLHDPVGAVAVHADMHRPAAGNGG